ncbi:tyrosine protein kinase [Hallella multisaccharivorax DSM 17128]|uniref:non-specific protein-tyrosine kinase n=1 Tax=Hallella multisaccharivorax DSM 17128 TaxID=688246 RepID=F8NBP6_9BACT|nr:polysaccharide biosynthesis tyrosine autokinase [Hallella multisaccharivorax]EGN58008.1 capsular exopolysaccharide family [Hallella multisaccharivorax DSM 17128]GJG30714.1 tyrosine protein kinase [Hallella multisaccharivorax DSM 17128]
MTLDKTQNNTMNTETGKQPSSMLFTDSFKQRLIDIMLNWKWVILSLIVCTGLGEAFIRYSNTVYNISEKVLIKSNDNNSGNSALKSETMGMVSNTNGFDNELEILSTHSLATQAVRDLKLYVNYYSVGKLKKALYYKNQPVNVGINIGDAERLRNSFTVDVEHANGEYHIIAPNVDQTVKSLPTTIETRGCLLKLSINNDNAVGSDWKMQAVVMSPDQAAYHFQNSFVVAPESETTTIARLSINDENPDRAMDYLRQLILCYNLQANEDKNEIARRTEEFINQRIAKINEELGSTEGHLESYKRSRGMVELKTNATQAFTQANTYEEKLADFNTQIALFDEMSSFLNNPSNRYQPLPNNVGIENSSITALVNNYNQTVQKRNLLLQSASESSPVITPLTAQLDQLHNAISQTLRQVRKSMDIQRSGLQRQYGKYQGEVGQTPEQERVLTQIGRQQEVKSGLYLLLLQKREENSISLAATADKGRIIDGPATSGIVSTKNRTVMGIAILVGLFLPIAILYLMNLLRYKIGGRDDVEKLTELPILSDVAIASKQAKEDGEIVVKENRNNAMEEVFRGLRSNLLFTLKEGEKVIVCTSSISGEGKTFISSNLAMSFAILGKKTIMIGLDIRKPRLQDVFGYEHRKEGITNLLKIENPSWEQIKEQILPSNKHDNLSLLPAGAIPPNPTELLARKSLDNIINTLKEHFDYIIIDSAPVGLVTDTVSIARVSDATVFVCRADYTPKRDFDLINTLAKEGRLRNVSVVINGIDMSKKKYGYYYGYGHYGYGHHYSYGYGGYHYGYSDYGKDNDHSIKK